MANRMTRSLSATLRPYLHAKVTPRNRDVYIRFFAAAARVTTKNEAKDVEQHLSPVAYRHRLRQLEALQPQGEVSSRAHLYPRLGQKKTQNLISITDFLRNYDHVKPGELLHTENSIRGRVKRVRTSGRKLIFVDINDSSEDVMQIMVSLSQLQKIGASTLTELDSFRKAIGVGDYWLFSGAVHKTPSGQLTLTVTELPQLLSPSLHVLPAHGDLLNVELIARFPQLDLVQSRKKREFLRLRHVVEQTISGYLDEEGFTKVSTPILAADTGGAAARPFETRTNEIANVPLRMRISPELALKKLVAANMGPVYEIGPCFRNEGLDSTHNPEFTTCEFYQPFASLHQVMSMTEELLVRIAEASQQAITTRLNGIPPAPRDNVTGLISRMDDGRPKHFKRLPFLPTLLERIHEFLPEFKLPQKLDETAVAEFLPVFAKLNLKCPTDPTIARILDVLGAHFIEPLCSQPTFITKHPAIMAPLAKSYVDPDTGHLVSARAELFIGGVEYVNLYEEENDPFAQAQKFLQQSSGADALVNEFGIEKSHEEIKKCLTPGQHYYVRVLEIGLPPTAGWGCGIERLVMLFGNAKRISDVLPFGNLRNVVAMGTAVEGGKLVVERAPVDAARGRNDASAERDDAVAESATG